MRNKTFFLTILLLPGLAACGTVGVQVTPVGEIRAGLDTRPGVLFSYFGEPDTRVEIYTEHAGGLSGSGPARRIATLHPADPPWVFRMSSTDNWGQECRTFTVIIIREEVSAAGEKVARVLGRGSRHMCGSRNQGAQAWEIRASDMRR